MYMKGMSLNTGLRFLSIFLLVLIFSMQAQAAPQLDPVILKNAVDNSIKAEGRKLGDYTLVDQDGVEFRLGEYFGKGKPLVLSYIYTTCPQVCPTITMELKKAVDGARTKYGDRFEVLTIAFDTAHDTPAAVNQYARRFTEHFRGFRFATGDEATIARLLDDTGFFRVRQDDGSFDHMDMVTVVKPDGAIYRQVYSLRTQPQGMVLKLEELIEGKAEGGRGLSMVDKFKFFCYRYDPYTGKYVLDYPVFVSIGIQALVIAVIAYAVWGRRVMKRFSKKDRK